MSDGRETAPLNHPRAALALAAQRWETLHTMHPTSAWLTERYYLGAVTCSDAPDQGHNVILACVTDDGAVRTLGGGYVVNEQPRGCGGRIVFNALQHRSKLIGVYALAGDPAPVHSARAFLRLPPLSSVSEVWVDHLRVMEVPVLFGDAKVLFLSDGGVHVALLPLFGASGLGALAVLREEHGGLTFTLYDRAPSSGETWGPQLTGCVMEVASSDEIATLEEFRQRIKETDLEDVLEGSVRTVTYTSGDDALSLSVAVGQERNARRSVVCAR